MQGELMIAAAIGGLFFVAALFAFVYFRGAALLQYYQQEEYDSDRFLRWLFKKRAFDKRATLIALVSFIVWHFFKGPDPAIFNLVFYVLILAALVTGALSSRPKKDVVKKPLVMTPRAQRIFYTYLMFSGIYFAGVLGVFETTDITSLMAAFVLFFQWPPVFLVAANFILKPFEDRINARFIREAEKKLAHLDPKIIAITGSYGKTSIKHILAHILASTAPTLATPGSVNTVLGITRVVRESLEARHKFFVVEMGAYGPGSIATLCKLTPPDLGIISAIGHAHYERFKSLETVFGAKFELADALQARGGKTIVNASAMNRDQLWTYMKKNPGVVVCVSGKTRLKAQCTLKSFEQKNDGLTLVLSLGYGGKVNDLPITVPLYGPHQAENVMLAVAAALELGLRPEVIRAALKTMPQIRHRLEVSKPIAGPIIIDDAYNSNPAGFRSALDLLKTLKRKGGRAILVTPGMVELGAAHDAEHEKIGACAGKVADIALVVGPERMRSFILAFEKAAPASVQIMTFSHQAGAEAWLSKNAQPKDTILFENNLPDLYEAEIRF